MNLSIDDSKKPYALLVLMGIQILCAIFFLSDVIADYIESYHQALYDWHLYIETLASLSLIVAIFFEYRYMLRLLRRKEHLEHNQSVASKALYEVIEAHFELWKLTPAEQDVATLLVNGCTIAQIAEFRKSAEGTVKSQLNAIYRKSKTTGRNELLSILLDSIIAPQ